MSLGNIVLLAEDFLQVEEFNPGVTSLACFFCFFSDMKNRGNSFVRMLEFIFANN